MNPGGDARPDSAMSARDYTGQLTGYDRNPDWWPYEPEFPDWHVWRGVAGLLYARRPRTSPPKIVRAESTAGLRDQIRLSNVPR